MSKDNVQTIDEILEFLLPPQIHGLIKMNGIREDVDINAKKRQEARHQIAQLLDYVIGVDEHYVGQVPPTQGVFDDIDNRNRLRAEQRLRRDEVLGVKADE